MKTVGSSNCLRRASGAFKHSKQDWWAQNYGYYRSSIIHRIRVRLVGEVILRINHDSEDQRQEQEGEDDAERSIVKTVRVVPDNQPTNGLRWVFDRPVNHNPKEYERDKE
jgi:hypothetical protein